MGEPICANRLVGCGRCASFRQLSDRPRDPRAHRLTSDGVLEFAFGRVGDAGKLKPGQAAKRVGEAIQHPFTIHDHFLAARYFDVRPPTHASDPTLTKSDFCTSDSTFEQYAYTEAWVSFLARKLASGRPWPWQATATDETDEADGGE